MLELVIDLGLVDSFRYLHKNISLDWDDMSVEYYAKKINQP
ncbi:hypothetical protein UNSWDHB_808 [Dehalobacter sp. UNSWDHB]|nr:hypothetical protein UNSWDHB_808 [Dehalobacter sp. UNSWDHB]